MRIININKRKKEEKYDQFFLKKRSEENNNKIKTDVSINSCVRVQLCTVGGVALSGFVEKLHECNVSECVCGGGDVVAWVGGWGSDQPSMQPQLPLRALRARQVRRTHLRRQALLGPSRKRSCRQHQVQQQRRRRQRCRRRLSTPSNARVGF